VASLLGVELDNGGVLLKFIETRAENGGVRHVQEARYRPHSAPPPYHCHPKQDERFEIVEGALHFHVDGVDRLVKAGEAIDLGKGAFHRAHNPGDVPVLAIWTTRPALRTGELYAALSRAGRGRSKPRLVDAAAILTEYRDEFRLAKPPALVQRIVFGCLAPFGNKNGG